MKQAVGQLPATAQRADGGDRGPEAGEPVAPPPARSAHDPRLAAGLSVIPGGGQLYNGEPRKAAFFFLATALTIGPAVALLMAAEGLGHSLLHSRAFTAFLLLGFLAIIGFIVLFVIGLGLWVSSAADARRTAAGRATASSGRWWFLRL